MSVEDIYDLLRRPAWHARAACREVGAAPFFPPEGKAPGRRSPSRQTVLAYQAATERYCSRCPVTAECLAAGQSEAHGLWGGQSPAQRRPRRRQAA
ncbi:MAG: WhiB family transcriptional regulator [Actinomycetota bacterium]|jgi:hypothetical protein|nr:WhiB family transcriptional regulator [Actinomycetota bacterium]